MKENVWEYEAAKIATMYRNGMSQKEIGKRLGRCDETIRQVIQTLGIEHQCIPVYDSPEQIEACLSCKRTKCNNCVHVVKNTEHRRKYAREYARKRRQKQNDSNT
mgnify:CR=1 FL=1